MKEPSEIKDIDSWNRFLTSGRVEDYLSYVSDKVSGSDWVGDSPHAGVYRGNRNHTEADTYR